MSESAHVVIFEAIPDEDYPPNRVFKIKQGDLDFRVSYTQDQRIALNQWDNFLKVMESNGRGSIVFGSCNGQSAISTENGKTTFEVSRYGDENFGDMQMTLPNNVCVDAIRQARDSCKTYGASR